MLKHRFKILLVGLIFFLVFLQYRLWLGPEGIKEMQSLQNTLSLQIKDNEKLKDSNQKLLLQVQRLQNSDDAVEGRARNELGMIKKNEKFYQIVR